MARRFHNPRCPYCGKRADLVGGDRIYPHRQDLAKLKFWLCAGCDAYTGTHKDSPVHAPKGALANAETRQARQEAHAAFDPLWKHGSMTRKQAYKWLGDEISWPGIPHIGFMTQEECNLVIWACERVDSAKP